jgi:hypothetical protein
MGQHAEFSPSKAHRFLSCTASHDLEKRYLDKYSEAAREGSRAHALADHCLANGKEPSIFINGKICETPQADGDTHYDFFIAPSTDIPQNTSQTFSSISDEMVDAVTIYTRFITDKTRDFESEKRIEILPNDLCYGTADCVFVRKSTLYVVDFKYGAGVGVNAENNEQLMCYAYGEMRDKPEIRRAKLVIIQPRHKGGRIEEWVISREDLNAFGDSFEIAVTWIANGRTSFVIGNHCKFCKAQGECPEKTKKYVADFDNRKALSISEVLNKADEIREWLTAVEQIAIDKLHNGETVQGYKLVPKQARSQIIDDQAALEAFGAAGYDVAENKLMSITKLKKIVPSDLLEKHIVKESRGMTLAREGDKRNPIDMGKEF